MVELLLHVDRFIEEIRNKYPLIDYESYLLACDSFVNSYYKATGVFNRLSEKRDDIVISLTTIPSRIDNLWVVLESIYRQTVQPGKLVLYISKDEFEGRTLPESLNKALNRGLIIVMCDNLYSHKKYYYAMQEFADKFVVTIDDDIVYSEHMLRRLLDCYADNPGSIICSRANVIKRINGRPMKYTLWRGIDEIDQKCIDNRDLFFTTGGGTLFPPKSLPHETFNRDVFMRICKTADDVWLNYMARMNGTSIAWTGKIDNKCHFYRDSQVDCLSDINLMNNGNDNCIDLMKQHYKFEL